MEAVYNDFEKFIIDSETGPIYNKVKQNTHITKDEYEQLTEFLLCEIPCNFEEFHLKKSYKYIANETNIYKNCKNRTVEYDYQEFDEYGPIDSGEEYVIDCMVGYDSYVPGVIDIVAMIHLLNTLIEPVCLKYFVPKNNKFINRIIRFCNHYHIEYPNINPKASSDNSIYFQKITFSKFKGFEYYYKKLFNYSIMLTKLGIPIAHQRQRNTTSFHDEIYGHPMASHGLCYESWNEIEQLQEAY